MKREETALTPVGADSSADHQLDIRGLKELAMSSESNLFKDAFAESGRVAAKYHAKVNALSRKREEDLTFNQGVDAKIIELKDEFERKDEAIWRKPYEGWDRRTISHLDASDLAKTILEVLLDYREKVNQIINSLPGNHRTPSVIISKLFENNNDDILNSIAENYHTDPSRLEPELAWLLNIAACNRAADIEYTNSQRVMAGRHYDGQPPYLYIPRKSHSLQELLTLLLRTAPDSGVSSYFAFPEDFFQTKRVRKFMVDFLVGGFIFNTCVEDVTELMSILFKAVESKALQHRINSQIQECEKTRKNIREETYVARLPRIKMPGKSTERYLPKTGETPEISESGDYATLLDRGQFPLVRREITRAIYAEAVEGKKIHPLAYELTGINAGDIKEEVNFYNENKGKRRFFMGAYTKNRLKGILEAARMQKPDEYAVMLANLYKFAHFFFTLGATLYQKSATTEQANQGFNYICFAVGLGRILERMVTMLETRLAVKETMGSFEMDDFVELAEAVNVLSEDPLRKINQGFITDMINKFSAAIEVQRAGGG